MEIINEDVKKNKKLRADEKNEIAKIIKANFDKWNDDRISQIDDAKRIIAEVYQNENIIKFEKKEDWKSKVKLSKLLCIKRAKIANLWREMWSNPEQMFRVKGTNKATQKTSKEQKAAMCDALNKMSIGKAYDDAMYNLLDIGESIFITDWYEKTKRVKRQSEAGFIIKALSRTFNIQEDGKYIEKEFKYYENARVRSISPFMFVFDHTNYILRDKDSWDKCQKIYKRFETIEALKSNKLYEISNEMVEKLTKEMDVTEENQTSDELIDKLESGNKHEILYMHGNIRYKGVLYKNYIAEVLAGRYLIRFEENPMYINPFILMALEYDPLTKRGISMLKAPLGLCYTQDELFNISMDFQKLNMNPPCYANESLFDQNEKEIKIAPGKIIKYKEAYNGSLPTAMSFHATALDSFIMGISNSIDNLSATNNNMNGTVMRSERKATELQLADTGAKIQISKDLDTINQDLTIPMIENIAELLAIFKNGDDFVFTKEKGKDIEMRITNEIRQAQYVYQYEDRNSLLEQKNKFGELFQLFSGIAKDPEMRKLCNWRELITTAVELVGFDNSDKFFMPESPLTNIYEQLIQASPEIQEMVAQQLQNLIQQVQEGNQVQNSPISGEVQ